MREAIMKLNLHHKQVVLYMLSFVLFLFAIAFSFTINNYTLGDQILNFLHIPCWSNGNTGTHYTVLYSAIFLIISYLCKPQNPQKVQSEQLNSKAAVTHWLQPLLRSKNLTVKNCFGIYLKNISNKYLYAEKQNLIFWVFYDTY